MLSASSLRESHGQNGGVGVDILRLSMNVKRNMLKEQEMDGKGDGDDNYHTKEQ